MIIIRLWLRELEGRKERWNQREDRGGKLCLCFRPCNFRISETESMVFLTKTRLGCLSFGLALVLLYRLCFAYVCLLPSSSSFFLFFFFVLFSFLFYLQSTNLALCKRFRQLNPIYFMIEVKWVHLQYVTSSMSVHQMIQGSFLFAVEAGGFHILK